MAAFDPRFLQYQSMERPHVVLLGAGASRAACPNGDRYGKKLPVMADLVEIVGLGSLLDSAGIGSERHDFELLYSRMVSEPAQGDLVAEIEQMVFSYFAALELPDEPTLYDHLVLSLRQKDIIASFNWDPFLVQAIARNQHIGPMPYTLFMHGNVAIGYCMEHPKVYVGARGNYCRTCGAALKHTPLLFPVTQKNYQNDPYVVKSWKWVQQELKEAFLLTVFGYGAPKTDVEAVELLKRAWDPDSSTQYKTMEIIDIRDEDELEDTWRPFFPSHYYQFHTAYDESFLSKYPRRSCESKFGIEMDGFEYLQVISDVAIPQTKDWDELHDWFKPLIQAEQVKPSYL